MKIVRTYIYNGYVDWSDVGLKELDKKIQEEMNSLGITDYTIQIDAEDEPKIYIKYLDEMTEEEVKKYERGRKSMQETRKISEKMGISYYEASILSKLKEENKIEIPL